MTEVSDLTLDALEVTPFLKQMSVELTTDCNLACVYCHFAPLSRRGKTASLAYQDAVVEFVSSFRVDEVTISGDSEVTLYKEWPAFARRLLATKATKLRIISNFSKGVFSEEEIDVLSLFGEIVVSLDVADAELLKKIRYRADLRTITLNIEQIRATALVNCRPMPRFVCNVVMHDKSIAVVDKTMAYAITCGFNAVQFVPYMPKEEVPGAVNSFMDNPNAVPVSTIHELSRGQAAAALLVLANAKRLAKASQVDFETSIPDEILKALVDGKTPPNRRYDNAKGETRLCLMPWNFIFPFWDGNVPPCCIVKNEVIANINDTPLIDIVNGPAMRQWRRGMLTGDLPPACRACSYVSAASLSELRKTVAQYIRADDGSTWTVENTDLTQDSEDSSANPAPKADLAVETTAPRQGPETSLAEMIFQARSLFASGQSEDAINILRQARQVDPSNKLVFLYLKYFIESYYNALGVGGLLRIGVKEDFSLACLSEAISEKGRTGEAANLLRQALRNDPDNVLLVRQLGRLLAVSPRVNEGVPYLEHALTLEPDDLFTKISLGFAYFEYGNFQKAYDIFHEAQSIEPNQPDHSLHLGWISARLGREREAAVLGERVHRETMQIRIHAYQNDANLKRYCFLHPRNLPTAIGEIALRLGTTVMAKRLGWFEPDAPLLVDVTGNISNLELLSYFKSDVEFTSDHALTYELNKSYPLHTTHFVPVPGRGSPDICLAFELLHLEWRKRGLAPLFSLTEEQRMRGRAELARLGVPEGAWFTVFHVRTDGIASCPTRTNRNANIEDYIPAMQEVVRRGGWVFRVGHNGMPPLPVMENVIDYAHSDARSDWMDIFLFGAARLFVATDSGPGHVAPLFGVPVTWTNILPHRSGLTPEDVVIYRRFRDRDGREFSFGEMFRPPLLWQITPYWCEANGITVIPNSAEEILEAVAESLDRVETRYWPPPAEEDPINIAFAKAVDPEENGWFARVGSKYLQRYARLLGPG